MLTPNTLAQKLGGGSAIILQDGSQSVGFQSMGFPCEPLVRVVTCIDVEIAIRKMKIYKWQGPGQVIDEA